MIISLDKISKHDTLLLKGLAICGMLIWHIFWCPNPQGVVFSPFIRYIGAIGDVCVSIFLFISGYGLTIGFQKKGEIKPIAFILSRLLKFYSNFWFVFILIVLFGTFFMNQPIYVEGTWLNKIIQFGKEFFAIRGQTSYNDSWWYFSLIISLYIIYPLLFWGIKKAPFFVILVTILCNSFTFRLIGQNIQLYIPIFIVGILWAMHGNKIPKISLLKLTILAIILIVLSLFILIFMYDIKSISQIGIPLYAILTIGLVFMVLSLQKNKLIIKIFCFIGHYATNIYIVHLMFSKYWFSDLFYGLKYPWMIFLALLIASLLFSVFVDFIKEISGYNKIFNRLQLRINDIIK